MKLIEPAFLRIEPRIHSTTYGRGLLGNTSRKDIEQMVLGLGGKGRSLQYFVGIVRGKRSP